MAWHKLRSILLKVWLRSKTCVWAYSYSGHWSLVGSLWYGILLKDQAQAIKEKVQMEFIVNVQNLTQCGKGKR